jgi:NADH-quinone oxidoreductase subunit J
MNWAREHAMFLITLAVAAGGVWWLMPQRQQRPRVVGLLLIVAAIAVLAGSLSMAGGPLTERALSTLFGGGALLCGALMITSRNPVYGALWFALVTLCTCGMFLLQSAPFLAAATIIVYAGAIIVTFLFVIMLSQQEGATMYDQRSRRPFISTVAAFAVLGVLLTGIETWGKTPTMETRTAIRANRLSNVAEDREIGTMHQLGKSLFGDYLFAVEVAGTLLLVASIGAIAIAPRRSQGTL